MAAFYARYPSSGSNPSIGLNGSPAPASSTEIGAIDPSGDLQALQVDATGNLLVSLASDPAMPYHVIVDSSALPLGASTEAKQDDQIVIEGDIQTAVESIDSKTPVLGQAAMAASVPVVIASDQSALAVTGPLTDAELRASAVPISAAALPLPTGAATSANQSTANASLSSIDAKLSGTLAVSGPLTDTELRASPVPISGTVTASNPSVGLDGAAAPASATLIGGKDGSSLLVPFEVSPNGVLSVDGSSVIQPVSGTVTVDDITNPIVVSSISNPVDVQATNLDIRDLSSATDSVAAVQSGTWNITNVSGTVSLPTGAATESTLSTLNGKVPANLTVTSTRLLVDGSGVTQPVSGTITVNPLTNSSVVKAQLQDNAGTAVVLGQTTMSASLPVTIASNQSAIATTQGGLSKSNAPVRNVYSSVNVTTSAYVQLVASTTSATTRLQIFDSSGQTLVLATGAAASEVDQIYIFPGGNGDVPLAIPAGTRVSIKAVSANATVGEIDINFLG